MSSSARAGLWGGAAERWETWTARRISRTTHRIAAMMSTQMANRNTRPSTSTAVLTPPPPDRRWKPLSNGMVLIGPPIPLPIGAAYLSQLTEPRIGVDYGGGTLHGDDRARAAAVSPGASADRCWCP